MKFTILLEDKSKLSIFNMPDPSGISLLDHIREDVGVNNLSLDKVRSKSKTFVQRYLEITEELARKSNLFQEVDLVKVYVPYCYLNEFAEIEISVDKNEETGEVYNVLAYYKANTDLFLERWEELGFPTEIEESKQV